MGTVVVKRAARRPAPEIPTGELVIDPPPEVPAASGSRWQQAFMTLPMLGGSVAMAMLMGQGRGGALSYVIGALFGISSLAMLATSFGGSGTPRKAEMLTARRDYLRHLAGLRRRVRDTVARQRAGLYYRHPDPAGLWSTVDSHRVWERRPADPDFAVIRVAVGPQTLATPLVPPVTRPVEDLEPLTAGALRRFLDTYSVVPDLPVAVSLRAFSRVFLRGSGAPGLARAILTQLAVFHAPDDLVIAVCTGAEQRARWEWAKWLPHALHPVRSDRTGPLRLFATSGAELGHLLEDVLGDRPRFDPAGVEPTGPHVVLVLDGVGEDPSEDGIDGVTVLDLGAPPRLLDRGMLVLDTGEGRTLHTYGMEHATAVGRPDRLSEAEAEAVARRLAPLRLGVVTTATDTPAPVGAGLADLLALGDPAALDVAAVWQEPRPDRDWLRVPIGLSVDGSPVDLDLKESAQDGMGPHGLLIGATGSGKSELLRTIVLALATTHSSETLNFVLIDFKGGATFASLDRLPHTAAVITNLADELPLVDRMVDAVDGELVRRQEVLRRAGNYASRRDYERARAGGADLPPLPSLLIICDEFSELLSAKPDFIDLFVQIGRLGRSLGVHLLLASQRLEEGRLRGLDTHLSYRIGLRTFSALESRTVLGVPDAYELPRAPGHGYLRFGTEPLVRFRAAYVSGPYRPTGRVAGPRRAGEPLVLPFSATPQLPPVRPSGTTRDVTPALGATLLDVLVDRLDGEGPPAHQVWLPPLEDSPTLDDLLGPLTTDPARGLSSARPDLHGALRVPVALIDKPRDQVRDVLWLHLAGGSGHVAIAGGTQSGKSTLLRSLVLGLALTHTPAEVQVYCLDFGGGALGLIRDVPHVGGVVQRLDPVGVRRTVGEISALLAERERRFADLGTDIAGYRAQRAAGEHADDPFGDVFLVVDGWSTIRNEFDDLENAITDIATRGLSYGIHIVAAAPRWMDYRPALRDMFGTRVELRLGDSTDSAVNRRAAAEVPDRPGRGIVGDGLHFLTVRPELHDTTGPGLATRLATAWHGPPAPRVRMLPASLPYEELHAGTGLHLPIGIAEADLRPVTIDFASDPHFVLFGDAECGKTSFLRALATTITGRFEPRDARIILVDYRRSLMDLPESDHRIGYGIQPQQTLELMQNVAGYMDRRLPGPDVNRQQLRDRSWWSGPELFVLVDDYDLVTAGSTNPLQPILDHLLQARDIGLHLIIARRAGGAARAMFDPVIQRLRELSSPGLVMAGPPDEGALIGPARPGPLPPGRGRLVTRREGLRLVQLAHLPPYPPS
ncbi:type VII secretion protein EccCa [Actinoplanes sp. RD1]|uniref:type VII secretion protein EccCa n=1 Tax=Actinoplanes sp. RD1 TaxID=3064538 RepID=UPI002742102A|nr:type VII secretion protein EccCa [Actinoplanes sp. RD1]